MALLDTIIITGGQGFIGSWIVKELLAQGAKPVIFDLREINGILEQVCIPMLPSYTHIVWSQP
jgi:nucleoside-diphosphate-sugar epimerase